MSESFQCQFCLKEKPVADKSTAEYGDGKPSCRQCEAEIKQEHEQCLEKYGIVPGSPSVEEF